ncbi:hypothetical protein D3C87_1412520 [compost metagenome]
MPRAARVSAPAPCPRRWCTSRACCCTRTCADRVPGSSCRRPGRRASSKKPWFRRRGPCHGHRGWRLAARPAVPAGASRPCPPPASGPAARAAPPRYPPKSRGRPPAVRWCARGSGPGAARGLRAGIRRPHAGGCCRAPWPIWPDPYRRPCGSPPAAPAGPRAGRDGRAAAGRQWIPGSARSPARRHARNAGCPA